MAFFSHKARSAWWLVAATATVLLLVLLTPALCGRCDDWRGRGSTNDVAVAWQWPSVTKPFCSVDTLRMQIYCSDVRFWKLFLTKVRCAFCDNLTVYCISGSDESHCHMFKVIWIVCPNSCHLCTPVLSVNDVVEHSLRTLAAKYVLHFVNLLTSHQIQMWPILTVVLHVRL